MIIHIGLDNTNKCLCGIKLFTSVLRLSRNAFDGQNKIEVLNNTYTICKRCIRINEKLTKLEKKLDETW